jgi:thiosulfate/3-mercaptopyruvate sulfurtransferase
MPENYSPIIEAAELLKNYNQENLIIVDASVGKNAKADYNAKHLAGALHVDLDTQLADIQADTAKGGRHPLPTMQQFSKVLTELGITHESHVVVYDDKNGSNAAARFWWMLQSAGHKSIQVLNGGFQEAIRAGLPTNSDNVADHLVEPYIVQDWQLPLSDMDEIEAVSEDRNYIVIDVRTAVRYNGETEPIDLVAGHIPGAINIPFTENLDENGLYLSKEQLRNKYATVFDQAANENIIVHCGSGVTACHTILAMAYAGYEIPKLYVGSWSEWSRNNKTIATKNN